MANQVNKLAYVDSETWRKPSRSTNNPRNLRFNKYNVAGQQFYQFFTNFAGKTEFQTNLTTNKLDSIRIYGNQEYSDYL
jgi:hypothetical protein